MKNNFKKSLEEVVYNKNRSSDYCLKNQIRIKERDYIRIKNRAKWMVLEMRKPTITIIKNFKDLKDSQYSDIHYSPSPFQDEDQKLSWTLNKELYE